MPPPTGAKCPKAGIGIKADYSGKCGVEEWKYWQSQISVMVRVLCTALLTCAQLSKIYCCWNHWWYQSSWPAVSGWHLCVAITNERRLETETVKTLVDGGIMSPHAWPWHCTQPETDDAYWESWRVLGKLYVWFYLHGGSEIFVLINGGKITLER